MVRSSASALQNAIDRRTFLRGSSALAGMGALGLSGCAKQIKTAAQPDAPPLPIYDAYTPLVPIRAHVDRIFRITVCLRPFRAAGPRMDVEKVGDKTVVHNYGHGGSGWSLSWGSATFASQKAIAAADGNLDIAVIGAGAIGLTSATMLQRAGAKVTIYAKERAPFTRSSRATGSWTPDSRVALASAVDANFGATWEAMAVPRSSCTRATTACPARPSSGPTAGRSPTPTVARAPSTGRPTPTFAEISTLALSPSTTSSTSTAASQTSPRAPSRCPPAPRPFPRSTSRAARR